MPEAANANQDVVDQRHDEEAAIDRGSVSNIVSIHCEREDLEGHRILSLGMRMPLVRQSHRHHLPHSQKHQEQEREKDSGLTEPGYPYTLSQRVQFILGTEEDEQHVCHDLFTELDEICVKEGEGAEWKETTRWLKFEEDVEDGSEHWSKPYVPTLSLRSLLDLRSCILNGMVLLDICANSMEEITDMILGQQEQFTEFDEHMQAKVREVLMKNHHHQDENKGNKLFDIVHFFADESKEPPDLHVLDKPREGSCRASTPLDYSCCRS